MMTTRGASRRRRRTPIWPLVLVGVLLVAGISIWSIKATERQVEAQVTFKERVCDRGSDGKQDCKYLIFTDEGTFKLTDSFLYGNFRSSDVYGRLRQDQCYRFTVTGWRLPFFSTYPNIVRAEDAVCS